MSTTITLAIDWNDDGDFSDSYEDVTARTLASAGVTTSRGRDGLRPLSPPLAGSLAAEMDNRSRDYSPENGASPIIADLHPGHLVRLLVSVGTQSEYDTSTDYDNDVYYDGLVSLPMFTGILDDLITNPSRPARSVQIPTLGTFSRLVGKRVSTALYQNILVSTAIGHLLDAAGWPVADRQISTAETTLDWWWLDDEDAWDALQTLVTSEGPGAVLYELPSGALAFESRHDRLTASRSTTSQTTISATGSPGMRTLTYRPPLQNIINQAIIDWEVRTAAGAVSVVWQLGQTVTLSGSESREFIARATGGNPVIDAVTPVGATDYTVASGSLSSVTLNRTSGGNIVITLTAGAGGASVTGLQLRAKVVSVAYSGRIANSVDASASVAKYGLRSYAYPVWPLVDYDTLQDFCNAIVGLYLEPRAIVELAMVNATAANEQQQLLREISDRITITDGETGLNDAFYIDGIRHRFDAAGRLSTVFTCEKVSDTTYGVWDTETWDGGAWGY